MHSTRILMTAITVFAASAATAQIWTQVTSPTTEDLNGVVVTPDLAVAVGNGGVVLRSDGGPWALVDSGTGNNLLDVAHNPGTGFVVGGVDVLLEGDGSTPFTPLLETMTGQAYTPVLPTDEEVWFGQPSFEFGGFSLLSRYDRASETTSGFVVQGPVLLLCAVPDTDVIRYVTTAGDVVELSGGFTTVLVDQSSSAPLELINGGFNEDCSQVVATDRIVSTLFDVLHVDLSPPAAPLSQRAAALPGPPEWVLKASDIFDEDELRSGYDISPEGRGRIVLWRVQKNNNGEDARFKVLTVDCLTYTVERIEPSTTKAVFDEDHNLISPSPPAPSTTRVPGHERVSPTGQAEKRRYVAVGREGLIAENIEDVPIFADGFEAGLGAWSQVSP